VLTVHLGGWALLTGLRRFFLRKGLRLEFHPRSVGECHFLKKEHIAPAATTAMIFSVDSI
jgi:hypothetical protein